MNVYIRLDDAAGEEGVSAHNFGVSAKFGVTQMLGSNLKFHIKFSTYFGRYGLVLAVRTIIGDGGW